MSRVRSEATRIHNTVDLEILVTDKDILNLNHLNTRLHMYMYMTCIHYFFVGEGKKWK